MANRTRPNEPVPSVTPSSKSFSETAPSIVDCEEGGEEGLGNGLVKDQDLYWQGFIGMCGRRGGLGGGVGGGIVRERRFFHRRAHHDETSCIDK